MTDAAKICTRCVMDVTDSGITFDECGVCDHCRTFDRSIQPSWNPAGDALALEKLVENIRRDGCGKDFDCIIGMSGGIDSSYLVYAAKEVMGLRPLVFHVDAGWNSQIAVNNIERIVDGLSLDLYTEVIDWEAMKDLQRAFFRSGVSHIDTPQDHAFFATMYKFATEHNVKNILTGANYSTECIRNPKEWMYYQSDTTQIKDIHSRFGEGSLDNFPLTSILWYRVWLPYVRGIRVLRPLNAMPYVKQQAMELLETQFGWQPYPQKHFESRFTRFYESYWLPERFGFDVRKVQYSSLILTGQMTRDEALEALLKPSYEAKEIEREAVFIANKLEITVEELNSYLTLPKKTYRDYKNQEDVYAVGSKLLRAMGIERGGKR